MLKLGGSNRLSKMSYSSGELVTMPVTRLTTTAFKRWKTEHPHVDASTLKNTRVTARLIKQRTSLSWDVICDYGCTLTIGTRCLQKIGTNPTQTSSRNSHSNVGGPQGRVESEDEYVSDPDEAEVDDGASPEDYSAPRKVKSLNDWAPKFIRQDIRLKEGGCDIRGGSMKDFSTPDLRPPLDYFLHFFPLFEMQETFDAMTQAGKAKYGDSFPEITPGLFARFLGCLIRTTCYPIPGQHRYFASGGDSYTPDFGFHCAMSYTVFSRIKEFFVLSGDEGQGTMEACKKWLQQVIGKFQAGYTPGSCLCVDESMISWTGSTTDMHLYYIKRKPKPLGVLVRTCSDGETNILVNAEIAESKEMEQEKTGYQTFGATTSCTLRLVEPWEGTLRIVVADSYFGSCRTVEELRERGLYAIMAVKTGHKGFPKDKLSKRLNKQGDTASYRVDVLYDDQSEEFPVYASGFFDKAKMFVVATTGTSLLKEVERTRIKYSKGSVEKVSRNVQMPEFHATYLKYFNSIDVLNKLSLGVTSMVNSVGTIQCEFRFFLATVGLASINAFNAHNLFGPPTQGVGRKMDKWTWNDTLSRALMCNTLDGNSSRVTRGVQTSEEGLQHANTVESGMNRSCAYCRDQTKRMCATCQVPLCSSNRVGKPCLVQHHKDATEAGDPLASAHPLRVKRLR